MSKLSEMEVEMGQEKEIGSIVQQFIYRLPKKNHEAMIQLEKQFVDGLETPAVCVMKSFNSTALRI